MEDPEFLKQTLEFYKLQLQESKEREQKQKIMYQSMLASLSDLTEGLHPTHSQTQAHLKSIQNQHQEALQVLQAKSTERQAQLLQKLNALQTSHSLLEHKSSQYLDQIHSLKKEILDHTQQKLIMEAQIRDFKDNQDLKLINKLTIENSALKQELEQTRNEAMQQQTKLREHTQNTIEELKIIYDSQKQKLQQKINQLQNQLENKQTEVQEKIRLGASLEYAYGQTADCEDAVESLKAHAYQVAEDWTIGMFTLVDDTNTRMTELASTKRVQISDLIKTYIDQTKEEVSQLRQQMYFFSKTISVLQNNQSILKTQIQQAKNQHQKLQMKMRIKASENTRSTKKKSLEQKLDFQSDKLIEKECEIQNLKKKLGDIRLQMCITSPKPPTSPMHNRSSSMSCRSDYITQFTITTKQASKEKLKKFEQIFSSVSALECSNCKNIISPEQFLDHLETCENQECFLGTQIQLEKLRKEISIFRIKIGKAKNARDRARLDYELVLFQLKQTKVDWAMFQEETLQKQFHLKKFLAQSTEALKQCLQEGVWSREQIEYIEGIIRNSNIGLYRSSNKPKSCNVSLLKGSFV